MSTDVTIERAREADYAAAVEVLIRSRRASFPAIPPSIHSEDDMRQHFTSRVFPIDETWIARRGDRVVAVMVRAEGWIEQLYVDPDHTGTGIGRRLLDAAKRATDRLDLWVFEANERARRFYERNGFVPIARTDGDNEEGAPDVHYRWDRRD